MNHLFVGALHRAAADAITFPEVFVILHAAGIFAVVTNQPLQALAQLRAGWSQTLQSGNHLLHLAGAEIFGNPVNPTVGLRRTLSVPQLGKRPGVFQGVPEVQNLTAAQEPRSAVPDPDRKSVV